MAVPPCPFWLKTSSTLSVSLDETLWPELHYPLTFDMGSFGCWVRCYWCEYWVYDPYIIDWIGHPLCDLCSDWHLGCGRFQNHPDVLASLIATGEWCGGPYEPTAISRAKVLLDRWLRQYRICDTATQIIAKFLLPWHDP